MFDIVYEKNEGTTPTDLTILQEELRQLQFDNITINKLHSYFLIESNGGLFMNGER